MPVPDAFDRSPIQLWTARPNGELDYVSASVLTYFGRTREQMLEWGWADLVHPEDLPAVGERWGASLETGEPYYVELRLKRDDGAFLWHIGRADPERDGDGAIARWLGANVEAHRLLERARS